MIADESARALMTPGVYSLPMRRFLTITVTGVMLIVLWGVLFEYKTCACGEKLSLADRTVLVVRGQVHQFARSLHNDKRK